MGVRAQQAWRRWPLAVLWLLVWNVGCCGTGLAAAAAEPPYDFPYKNGLYGTIAGGLILYRMKIDVPERQTLKLQVPTMRKAAPVCAVIQNKQAPLVVLLLGIEGKADANSGKLWMKWYAEAGYHVLTFDSTFTPPFVVISGHGVTGNMTAEATRVTEMVNTFIHLPQMEGKITQIGVVGMSYGGIQALTVGRLVREGKIPFKVAAIQSYSPPVNLSSTGGIIDRWFDEDRWNYKLTEMAFELLSHKPVTGDEAIPFSDSMLRAAIAALFRMSLAETIDQNDKVYKLKLLPEESRSDYAAAWGFSKFMQDMVIPYWAPRLKLAHPEDIVASLSLAALLQSQPPGTEVIEAADDPFNDPAELAAVRNLPRACALTVVPRGGHLGYIMHPWIRAKLLRLFEQGAAPVQVVVKATPDVAPPKPAVPQVTATATGTEERRSAVALFAGAFRCGDKPLVEKALAETAAHPDYLFGTIGWPELVAEIAARSGAEIQPLLLVYLAQNVKRMSSSSLARVAKLLPGVNLETYLGEQRIAAWNANATGADDAAKALTEAVRAKDFATARAELQLIEKKGQLKLLVAVAGALDTENADVNNAALAVFKVHQEALEADTSSPMRCLIWWRLSGRQRLNELLKAEP